MKTLDTELIEISLEALSKHKVKIDSTARKLDSIDSLISKDKESATKELSDIHQKIKDIDDNLKSEIKSQIPKIPIPKDGKDGIHGSDGIDGKNGAPGKKGTPGNQGRQGLPGKPGVQGKDGKTGKPGEKGKTGIHGTDGSDGVGIKEVRGSASAITIELTNGKEKVIKLPKTRANTAGGGFVSGTPANSSVTLLTDTTIDRPTNGDVLTFEDGRWINETPTGGATDIDNFQRRTEIESMFKVTQSVSYKELIYTDGNITNIDLYASSSKSLKLFSKIIGYNIDNNIVTIDIVDETNNDSISKILEYATVGSVTNISNITTTYTKS